jgi:hypothetical protein
MNRDGSIKSARLIVLGGAAILLAGCGPSNREAARSEVPIPSSTMALMSSKGMSPADPILIRAYKMESVM